MSATLKVEHINPFIISTQETMATMAKCEAKPGKIRLKSAGPFHCDLSGLIGLSGGAKGSVALGFPRITALKIVGALTGQRTVALDKDTLDAVGELANIVAGAAKKHLQQYRIQISLPTVVMGDGHEILGPSDTPALVVPFESACGPFILQVCFRSES